MKMSKVFRKAAQLIKEYPQCMRSYNHYTCLAIDILDNTGKTRNYYECLMEPTFAEIGWSWWNTVWTDPLAQDQRRFALLFAAEVAESEGL